MGWCLLVILVLRLDAQLATDTLRLRASLMAARETQELAPLPYAQLRQEYFAWIDTRVQDRRSTSQMNSESRGAALFVVVNSEDDRR
ncbi:MAG: hypothetical protein JNK87_04515, partial [Bryobacterales bacterium]|nr:hypothetical protein [Bryobacterales bacterium]